MDESRFEALVRYLSTTPSRRHALRVLAGSTLGGFLAIDQLTTNAKKKKGKSKGKKKGKGTPPCVDSSQITICHNGLTISVSNCALPAHQAHGDTVGACFCFDKPDLTDCGGGQKCSGGVCAIEPICDGFGVACVGDADCCSDDCAAPITCQPGSSGKRCHDDNDCASNTCVGFVCA